MTGSPKQRRLRARAVIAAGVALLALSIATEFIGAQWWSTVDLKRLQQTYVILSRGHVVLGERGTAGFFNRGIPSPGMAVLWPRDYTQQSWMWRVLIMTHSRVQNRGVGIPLVSPGLLIGGIGCWLYWRLRPRRAGLCQQCGYDLTGLSGGACPECGTLVDACASSTSQPG